MPKKNAPKYEVVKTESKERYPVFKENHMPKPMSNMDLAIGTLQNVGSACQHLANALDMMKRF